jgi:chromosome segregation ATPase
MATVAPQPEHTYEIRVDQLEVTSDGAFGGPRDMMRRFVSGPRHYYINGHEVSQQRYETAVGQMSVGPTYRQ